MDNLPNSRPKKRNYYCDCVSPCFLPGIVAVGGTVAAMAVANSCWKTLQSRGLMEEKIDYRCWKTRTIVDSKTWHPPWPSHAMYYCYCNGGSVLACVCVRVCGCTIGQAHLKFNKHMIIPSELTHWMDLLIPFASIPPVRQVEHRISDFVAVLLFSAH